MSSLYNLIEELIKECNDFEAKNIELEARNNSLERINQGLVDAINQSDDDGRHVDIVWLTRDELKEYSDIQQAGGINSVKADAIASFVDCVIESGQLSREDNELLKTFELEVVSEREND